jgi:hypothetical protein
MGVAGWGFDKGSCRSSEQPLGGADSPKLLSIMQGPPRVAAVSIPSIVRFFFFVIFLSFFFETQMYSQSDRTCVAWQTRASPMRGPAFPRLERTEYRERVYSHANIHKTRQDED